MPKKRKNNSYKEVVREADMLKKAALANAKHFINEQLSSSNRQLLDEQLRITEEDDEMPDRVEDEEELEEGSEYGFDGDETVEKQNDLHEEDEFEDDDEIDEDFDLSEEDEIDLEDDEDDLEESDEMDIDDEEEVDLDEIIAELEDDDEDFDIEDDEEMEEAFAGESEDENIVKLANQKGSFKAAETDVPTMSEAKRTIRRLQKENAQLRKINAYRKKTINEVALFNKKLHYATRIADIYALNINEKKKVYEQFDKANSGREARLVYESLKSVFASKKDKKGNRKRSLTEFASRTRTKKGKELVTEDIERARNQKLAGIIGS